MRFTKFPLSILATILLCQCSSQPITPFTPPSPETSSALSRLPLNDAVMAEVNRYRTQNGRPALRNNSFLSGIATQHSTFMARTGQLDHQGFGKRVFLSDAAEINPIFENVGYSTQPMPASDIVQKWSTSEGHRKNMLGMINVVGVGTASANGRTYATLISGIRPAPGTQRYQFRR